MSDGFCDRCHHMLTDRKATLHETPEECVTAVQAEASFWRDQADRQHAWVHRLEDVIAALRRGEPA